ncbi:putative protein-lysine deacylase ABHD14B [Saccoglossus kowalevskii]|uniref:Alpha/beta hydrolase domain-containing protein 14A-like n=1 Tax=Saccoglossus kowalevskii TaxID=10224 RepID=A0ABM0H149_SACKO|nr:PREDICTED: alpha/beta hydrolase domain-containing protein 14A-like [Saccoglossus kowalevskii]
MQPIRINLRGTGICVGIAFVFLFLFIKLIFSHSYSSNSSLQSNSSLLVYEQFQSNFTRTERPLHWSEREIEEIPQDLKVGNDYSTIGIRESSLLVEGASEPIYLRESLDESKAESIEGSVLLLHGSEYSSHTWLELGTLHQLAKLGYRAVAIDLPGYVNSKNAALQGDPSTFLANLIERLNLGRPVIISPSMSGDYALPLVMKRPDLVRGFVPVAPTSTSNFTDEQYAENKTPTMIVYGELDTQLGDTSYEHLKHMPDIQLHKIHKANHAAYIDFTDRFHQLLYNFLKNVPK